MQHSEFFPELIENTLELVCEFNNVFGCTYYEKYIPLQVMVTGSEDAVMHYGSESLQAARIAGAIYQYLDTNWPALEAQEWPSIKVEIDGWTAILVTPDDQAHLSRDARKLLTCT